MPLDGEENEMQRKLLNDSNGQRTFAVILETGDEVQACMKTFIQAEGIRAAQLTAIGAFSDVELLYFDWKSKKYHKNAIAEQVEVASLIGDVVVSPSGESALHIHVVVGRRDCTALAGHLGQAHVRPTLEVLLIESPTHLHKRFDKESGLALIRTDT
ncbi:MAG: PPC domain-containing DNA-binding protein [Xanthobacteraceae bacterium]